eukprot:Skav215703  [mRNA]  locus=scaffold2573:50033:55816:- [translate_table: standard]
MDQFTTVIRTSGLIGLNTWNPRLGPTYQHLSHSSRIDFIFTRPSWADGAARQVTYVWDCPLISAASCHVPILAHIPRQWIPMHRLPQVKCGYHHRLLGRAAWLSNSGPWQTFLERSHDCIESFFASDHPCTSLATLHSALVPLFCSSFSKPPLSHDSDTVGATLIESKWNHRRLSRIPRSRTLHDMFQAWKHWSRFVSIDKRHRLHARHLRRQKVHDLTVEAETAASKHDHFQLFRLIQQYSPKESRRRICLVTPTGSIATPTEELAILSQFVHQTWSGPANFLPEHGVAPGVPFQPEDLLRVLSHVPVTKSVARGCAPGLLVRAHATSLTRYLFPLLMQWWHQYPPHIPDQWKQGWLTWLPKPGRKPNTPGNLRPIALQEPVGKGVLQLITRIAQHEATPQMIPWPQWAFMAHRSTQDALIRVTGHCKAAQSLVSSQRLSVHAKALGTCKHSICGGIQLLVDLSKAFDSINRHVLFQGLATLGVSSSIQTLLRSWHSGTSYLLQHADGELMVPTGKGVRQGCSAAPFLFNTITTVLLRELAKTEGSAWVQQNVTLFADDIQLCGLFTTPAELHKIVRAMGRLLDLLTQLGLTINPSKSVALITWTGPMVGKAQKQYMHRQGTHMFLQIPRVDGTFTPIEVHPHATYLGIRIGYHQMEDMTLQFRLKAGWAAFKRLSKWFHRHSRLHIRTKLRLWHACVFASIKYGLFTTGLTTTGLNKLLVVLHQMIRSLAGDHAYRTHHTHADVLARIGCEPPIALLCRTAETLQASHRFRLSQLSPDDLVHQVDWSRLDTCIHFLYSSQVTSPTIDASLPLPVHHCPYCDFQCSHLPTLRRHCTTVHHISQVATIPLDHRTMAVHGLPTCARCQKSFTTWRQFRLHVSRPCAQDSFFHPTEGSMIQPEPANEAPATLAPALRFLHKQPHGPVILKCVEEEDWDGLAQHRDACSYLANHCVLCGAFANRPQNMNAHHRQHHGMHFHEAMMQGISMTKTYTVAPTCHYCEREFRQTHTCNVFTQLAILQRILQPPEPSPRSPLQCRYCPQTFTTGKELSDHLRYHHQSGLGAGADMDEALPVPEIIVQHLRQGTLTTLLQDPHLRQSLTLTCQFCGQEFHRLTDLCRHLQAVHVHLWTKATDLTLYLQTILHPALGCVCDPAPDQARTSHSCPGFRQLAMISLRLHLPVLVPFECDTDSLQADIHQSVDHSFIARILTQIADRDFEMLWVDDDIHPVLATQCLQCGLHFQAGELLFHILELHGLQGQGLTHFMKQLVQYLTSTLADVHQCPMCDQFFSAATVTDDAVRLRLAQTHLTSQCPVVFQVAWLLVHSNGNRPRPSGARALHQSTIGRSLSQHGLARHGSGRAEQTGSKKQKISSDRTIHPGIPAEHSEQCQPLHPPDAGGPIGGAVGPGDPKAATPGHLCSVSWEGTPRTDEALGHRSTDLAFEDSEGRGADPSSHVPCAEDDSRTPESSSIHVEGYTREPPVGQCCEVGLVDSGSGMALLEVGSAVSVTDSDQGSCSPNAGHADSPQRDPGCIDGAGIGGPISFPSKPTLSSGIDGSAMETPTSQPSPGARALPEAGTQQCLAPGMCPDEGAHSASFGVGDGYPEPAVAWQRQEQRQGIQGQRAVALAADLTRSIPRLRLQNPLNHCPLNSTFLAWIWSLATDPGITFCDLGDYTNVISEFVQQHSSHGSCGDLSLEPWIQRVAWCVGTLQSDPAEFVGSLMAQLPEVFQLEWQRRVLVEKQPSPVDVDDHFDSPFPLTVQFPDKRDTLVQVQGLVYAWQRERGMFQALLRPPHILCLHIDRLVQKCEFGSITKNSRHVSLSDPCYFPVYDPYDCSIDCLSHEYDLVAAQAHLGLDGAGHYRSALRTQEGWWITEDGVAATFTEDLPPWFTEGVSLVWYRRHLDSMPDPDPTSRTLMEALSHVPPIRSI